MSASLQLPSLKASPHLQWKPFFRALYLAARNAGLAYFPANGCLHFILPDNMWLNLPGHHLAIPGIPGIPAVAGAAAAAGVPAIAPVPGVPAVAAIPATPRPVTTLVAITAAMNQGYRDEAKANNLMHVDLISTQQALRAAIFEAIGPIIQGRLVTDEVTGNIDLNTWVIIEMLQVWYGTLSAADVNGLLAQLDIPISNDEVDTFIEFHLNFKQTSDQAAIAGAPLSEFLKLQKMATACADYPYILEAIKDYTRGTPILINQTLEALALFVIERLNNKPIGGTAQSQGYWSAPKAAATLPPRPSPHNNGRHAGRGGRGRGGRGAAGGRGMQSGPFYCYFHGTNNSHPGYLNDNFCCLAMTPDPTTGVTAGGIVYTMEQRTARHAGDVAAGTQEGKA